MNPNRLFPCARTFKTLQYGLEWEHVNEGCMMEAIVYNIRVIVNELTEHAG